jgi:tRNA modification GTPase
MAPLRPLPRLAALRAIRDPQTTELLDYGLVLWFAGPKSETGEDMAEFHVHGGRAVIQGVLAGLGKVEGCRLAEPGEFARRAFENGKLELTGAEGLADLIDAETAVQRRQALQQAGGALARLYEGWRQRLIRAIAQLEAAIDFADEPDVTADSLREVRHEVEELMSAIAAHLDDGNRGELVREGFQVVLAGAPNVGKSSLLNALARRDVAIVSEEEGTTRDVIEVKLELEGLPIVVSDTAGIREVAQKVEQEGIRRALGRARAADLILWLVDAAAPAASVPQDVAAQGERTLVVVNKMDLLNSKVVPVLPDGSVGISAQTGFGLDGLTRRVAAIARARMGNGEIPALTQMRHRQHLERCRAPLTSFLAAPSDELELRAEDLRRAATALGRLTGAIDVEDVLGEIFGRFCIGK